MYRAQTEYTGNSGRHVVSVSQEDLTLKGAMLDSLSTPGRGSNPRTDSMPVSQQAAPYKPSTLALRHIKVGASAGLGPDGLEPYTHMSSSSEMSLQDRTSRWVLEHGATEQLSAGGSGPPSYPTDPSQANSPAAATIPATAKQVLTDGRVQVMEDLGLGLVGLQGVGQGVVNAPHLEQLQQQLRDQVKELSNVTSLSITSDQLPNALLFSLAHQLVSLEVTLKLPASTPGAGSSEVQAHADAGSDRGSVQGEGGAGGTERDAIAFARYRSAWAVTVQFLEQCSRLRSLTIDVAGLPQPATAVPSICRAAPLLEHLSLRCVIDTRGAEALLAMKHLTDVAVFSFDDVDVSFADQLCRWERVSHMSRDINIRFLALLPLLSLKEPLQYTRTEGEDDNHVYLVLPRAASDEAGLQAVKAAALNVPPAFLSDVHIAGIKCDPRGPPVSETVASRMLEACKPLVQKPSDQIALFNLPFGYEMVLAVSGLVNRFKLHRLHLQHCTVAADMWAHMLRTLPRLDHLSIVAPLNTLTCEDFERLHRALAGRPLTINLTSVRNLSETLPDLIRLTHSQSGIQLLQPPSGNTATDVVIAFNPGALDNPQARLTAYHAPRTMAAVTTHQTPIILPDVDDLSSCGDPFDYPTTQEEWEGEAAKVDASWHKASYQAFLKKCEENLQLQSDSEDSLSDLDF